MVLFKLDTEIENNEELLSKLWQISDEFDSLSYLNNKLLNGTISIRLNIMLICNG